jgi:hypothetical protein
VLSVPDAMTVRFLGASPLRRVGLSAPIATQFPLQSLARIPCELVAIPLSKQGVKVAVGPLRLADYGLVLLNCGLPGWRTLVIASGRARQSSEERGFWTNAMVLMGVASVPGSNLVSEF